MEQASQAVRLSRRQTALLAAIVDLDPPVYHSDIERYMTLDRQGVDRDLCRLQTLGFVVIENAGCSARKNSTLAYSLTEQGRDLFATYMQTLNALLRADRAIARAKRTHPRVPKAPAPPVDLDSLAQALVRKRRRIVG